MILEDELPAFMEEVRRRALLACDNKPEYVKALRESPTFLFVLQAEFRLGNLLLQLGLKKVFVRQFSVVLGDSSESPLLRFDGIQWQLQSIVLYRRNLPLISLRDQNHLPRGCAPECIGMGVSVEGLIKARQRAAASLLYQSQHAEPASRRILAYYSRGTNTLTEVSE